mmetsp:Transcript_5445/g.7592  ORF Transcript_5445/g.7592 Transcript_5445/m.7592 type:complete len:213 (+) Transcript_5445:998-1636(+)
MLPLFERLLLLLLLLGLGFRRHLRLRHLLPIEHTGLSLPKLVQSRLTSTTASRPLLLAHPDWCLGPYRALICANLGRLHSLLLNPPRALLVSCKLCIAIRPLLRGQLLVSLLPSRQSLGVLQTLSLNVRCSTCSFCRRRSLRLFPLLPALDCLLLTICSCSFPKPIRLQGHVGQVIFDLLLVRTNDALVLNGRLRFRSGFLFLDRSQIRQVR